MMQENKAAGHIIAIFTVFIWGTTFISTKVLLKEFSPVEILFYRFLIGLAALAIAYPHRMKKVTRRQEITYALAGLCGVTLYYLLENIALTYTLASNIGVIISIAPIFTAILAHFFMGERLKASFFIGFIAAMLGIALISFNGSREFQLKPTGDLLAVLAAVVWAIYSMLIKDINTYPYHTIQSTRKIFSYGLLFMVPALFLFDFRLGLERFANPVHLGNILFLGVGACAVCFATWNIAVKILGVVKASVYIYLVPVVTVAISIVILKEKITFMAAAGTMLTLAGLFLSESRIRPRKRT